MVPVSATLAAWLSCPIIISFTTPMGSYIHTTAPGWLQYGTTYQAHSLWEARTKGQQLSEMNGMEVKRGEIKETQFLH